MTENILDELAHTCYYLAEQVYKDSAKLNKSYQPLSKLYKPPRPFLHSVISCHKRYGLQTLALIIAAALLPDNLTLWYTIAYY
jgi:hypothetical protein